MGHDTTIPSVTITVEVNGELHKRNLNEDLDSSDLGPETINHHAEKINNLLTYWNWLHTVQASKVQRIKTDLKRKEAELSSRFKKQAQQDGSRLTDKTATDLVASNIEYQNLEDALLNEENILGQLKVGVDGLSSKKSMIITLASNYRSEMNMSRPLSVKGTKEESLTDRFKKEFQK